MGFVSDVFGKDDAPQEPESSRIASDIARRMFQETTPIRENVFGTLQDFTGGDFDISTDPAFAPGKLAIEDQFGRARESVLANVPAGGQLTESLTDVDIGRAKSLTDLIGGIEQDLFAKSLGVATGMPQTSISGLQGSAAAQLQAQQIAQQQEAAKGGMFGDLGLGAGMLLGGK